MWVSLGTSTTTIPIGEFTIATSEGTYTVKTTESGVASTSTIPIVIRVEDQIPSYAEGGSNLNDLETAKREPDPEIDRLEFEEPLYIDVETKSICADRPRQKPSTYG